jgi:prepilin-type N-terminal cleavage/methylation domain-containing protein
MKILACKGSKTRRAALGGSVGRGGVAPGSGGGFTLVELLVVIAILGVLMSLLLPGVSGVRERASRTACSSNLRQIGVAALLYHSDHNEFPAIGGRRDSCTTAKWGVTPRVIRGLGYLYQGRYIDSVGIMFCANFRTDGSPFGNNRSAHWFHSNNPAKWNYDAWLQSLRSITGYVWAGNLRDEGSDQFTEPMHTYPPILGAGMLSSSKPPNGLNAIRLSHSPFQRYPNLSYPCYGVLAFDLMTIAPISYGRMTAHEGSETGGNVLLVDGRVEWYRFTQDWHQNPIQDIFFPCKNGGN